MLSGEVASYQEKLEAERAALRVEGVKGAANEIDIPPMSSCDRRTRTSRARPWLP